MMSQHLARRHLVHLSRAHRRVDSRRRRRRSRAPVAVARPRVAIARALLKDSPLVLMDEATSALDTNTEKDILTMLEVLMKGKTTIVVAHRLSTARNCDNIALLEDGRVVEYGSHDALLRRGGKYHAMWEQQNGASTSVGKTTTHDPTTSLDTLLARERARQEEQERKSSAAAATLDRKRCC